MVHYFTKIFSTPTNVYNLNQIGILNILTYKTYELADQAGDNTLHLEQKTNKHTCTESHKAQHLPVLAPEHKSQHSKHWV